MKEYFGETQNRFSNIKSREQQLYFRNLLSKRALQELNLDHKDFKDFLKNKNIKYKFELLIFLIKRFCGKCSIVKPQRTHHCRQCGRCVLKMDHHCNWLDTCIGFRNYKFFLNFIFWTWIILIFLTFKQFSFANKQIPHSYVFFHYETEMKEAIKEGMLSPDKNDFFFFIKHFFFYFRLFIFNLKNPHRIPNKFFDGKKI